jgi:hypothetical protein
MSPTHRAAHVFNDGEFGEAFGNERFDPELWETGVGPQDIRYIMPRIRTIAGLDHLTLGITTVD